MVEVLCVGFGGFLGSVGRYLLSLVPVPGAFPVMTLVTNVIGAVVIGFVVALADMSGLSPKAVLFLKTGVCGGFTTFSTFSLETVTLWQNGQLGLAGCYAALSVGLCVAGVVAGEALGRTLAAGA